MLSREFLYQLEDELTRARHEIDERYQMAIEELREALKYGVADVNADSIPISYRYGDGLQTYTIDGKKITVGRYAPISEVVAEYLKDGTMLANPFEEPAYHERKHMSAPAKGSFAASIRAMMDEARAGVAKAREDGIAKVGEAVGKLDEAKIATVKVAGSMAKMVEDEAADVMAELGQISNDLGGE